MYSYGTPLLQKQPSVAVCNSVSIHADCGWAISRVLRTTKLLTKVAICINIFRYTWQILILFDLNILEIGNFVPIIQKRSAGMRTAAYNVDVASDRRRRKNVPRHILCSSKLQNN